MTDWRRVRIGVVALAVVIVAGTMGFLALGFSALDSIYQTVTTVTTVGFRETRPLSPTGKVFTIGLILAGVGTVLYTLGMLMETLIDGQLSGAFGRRSMQRKIQGMSGHVIICGWGRVGRAIASELIAAGLDTVVIDHDATRFADLTSARLLGDATEDAVLEQAGVRRARAMVAALDTDAGNLFATLSARSLAPSLFIISRVKTTDNEEKLRRAGADRVVNLPSIGGARMAAFVLQPHVTEFLDVVMHDRDIEFRLEEVVIPDNSPLAGRSLRDAHIRDRTGALVLAMRDPDMTFVTNPKPDQVIMGGQLLIAIGTRAELDALGMIAAPTS